MRPIHSRLAILLITMFIIGLASPSFAGEKPDPRLAQKVTYEPGPMRLHQVTEDLSKLTGVQIEAGKNMDDYQVRDLPVTVLARELPLGVMLQAIADATNVELQCSTVSGKTVYRFVASESFAKRVDSFWEKRRKKDYAADSKAWATLVRHANLRPTKNCNSTTRAARLLGKIMSSLPAGTKQKVLNGGFVQIDIRHAKKPQLLRDLYTAWMDHADAQMKCGPADRVPADQLTICVLVIGHQPQWTCLGSDGIEKLSAHLYTLGKLEDELLCENLFDDLQSASQIADAPSQTYDEEKIQPSLSNPKLDRKYTKLPAWDDYTALKRSRYPILRKPVEVIPQAQWFSYKDKFDAINKSTGFSLIYQEFCRPECLSRRCDEQWTGENGKLREASVLKSTVLDCLPYGVQWHMDKKNKLFLGNGLFCQFHRNILISEKTLEHIEQCVNDQGAELDDFLMLEDFTKPEKFDAPENSIPGLNSLNSLGSGGIEGAMWTFYASLSPEQKAAVKSPEGLRIDNYDPKWFNVRSGYHGYMTEDLLEYGEGNYGTQNPFDKMVHPYLHLEPYECSDCGKKHYSLTLEERSEGRVIHSVSVSTSGFPVYSEKREAELKQQSGKRDKQ